MSNEKEYKTLNDILYNGYLEQNSTKTTQFIDSLNDKNILKTEAKNASKIANELTDFFVKSELNKNEPEKEV